MMVRRGRGIARGFLALLALLSLSSPAWAADRQELSIALSGRSTLDDPHQARTGADFQYFEHIFDTLVTRDGFGVTPRLAIAWNSTDNRIWSFRIRNDARFSNGRSVTATDVAYSLCRFETLSREIGGNYLGLSQVEVTGTSSLTLHLDSAYRLLPAALSLVFVVAAPADGRGVGGPMGCDPAKVLAGRGNPQLGSGPYVAADSPQANTRRLVASPYYGAEAPPWRSLNLISEPDARERLRLLLAGTVDIMEDVPPFQLPYFQRQPNVHLTELPTDRVLLLTFNMAPTGIDGQPNPLADSRVRRAIHMAIDRWALVERGLAGVGGPAWQLAQPGMEGWLPARATGPASDIQGARHLLAEAGYPDGFAVDILMPRTRVTNQPRVVELLAGMLRAINIQAQVEPIEGTATRERIRKGDFTLAMSAIGLTAGSAMEGLEATAGPLFHHTGTNPSGYEDAQLTALLAKARAAPPAAIPALAAQAAAILDRDMPMIPLLHMRDLVAHRADLTIAASDTARAFGRITWPATAQLNPPP
ncbi:ABC transporter substrate-binding protein [Niveispirillum sp. BGYR6]|uniref:ABC transporter substrate-binding protein n=1 Tax=Niveispirillum sp. BGYR6 TaxID=2971249 RepID=UPI0022B99EB4|nr:ABC transporter substrate-binding protein [Niveispirillum sp. BGYR6]MDG5495497.1 ABC transporter substrate-binding protein [Niveispirillum sp. BGYR6]